MKRRFLYSDLLIIFFLAVIVGIIAIGVPQKATNIETASANADQGKNFNDDLKKADDYWGHNNLAWDYQKSGQYDKAVDEYKKAIEVIQNSPGDEWPNLKKEDADRINQNAKIDAQIFSRYGLIEALDRSGKYEEAIQNVDWLMQNQQMKGKEEFLKKKLEGMKQNLLQKMRSPK